MKYGSKVQQDTLPLTSYSATGGIIVVCWFIEEPLKFLVSIFYVEAQLCTEHLFSSQTVFKVKWYDHLNLQNHIYNYNYYIIDSKCWNTVSSSESMDNIIGIACVAIKCGQCMLAPHCFKEFREKDKLSHLIYIIEYSLDNYIQQMYWLCVNW